MRKCIYFIAILLMGTTYVSAQEFVMFGAKGGVNFSTFSGDGFSDFEDESSRTSYHLGLLAEIPISARFSIQPEVLYSAQGYDLIRRDNAQDVEHKLDYVTVPVLAKVYLFEGFSLEAGPQFGFLADHEIGDGQNDLDISDDNLNKFDLSLALGAGLKFNNFFLYGRYNAGMSEIYDNQGADAKHSVIQAGIGFLF